ncbi:MAG: hypothetical protein GXO10_04790 [Crenarchaeota archaeon]|nr:hypothetical protein [Thermoproteota archaeon]
MRYLNKILALIRVGIRLSRFFITSYISIILNSVFWGVVVFGSALVFAKAPLQIVYLYLPGLFVFGMASGGTWAATDYFRFYYHQGLTDMFLECGVGILEYSLMTVLVDGLLISSLTFMFMLFIASVYANVPMVEVLPRFYLPLIVGILSSIPIFIFSCCVIGLLLVITPIEVAWINMLQFIFLLGTIIPPQILGTFSLFLPWTIPAELVRAAYGTNMIPIPSLYMIDLIDVVLIIIVSVIIARICDKQVRKKGITIRKG